MIWWANKNIQKCLGAKAPRKFFYLLGTPATTAFGCDLQMFERLGIRSARIHNGTQSIAKQPGTPGFDFDHEGPSAIWQLIDPESDFETIEMQHELQRRLKEPAPSNIHQPLALPY